MDDRISRRRLLSTATAGGLTIGVVGCLDQFDGESDDGDDSSDAGSGPESGDDENGDESEISACEAGTAFLESTFDGQFEEAGEYYPYEYLESYDRDYFVDYLENRFAETVDGYELAAADCAESTDEHDVIEEADDELDAEVTDGEWLTYDLDLETDGKTVSETIDVLAVEIDGTWYAGVVDVAVRDAEVTVEIAEDGQTIDADADGETAAVVVSVLDENGNAVPEATVIASEGSAELDGPLRADAGVVDDDLEGSYDDLEDHQAVLNFDGRQSLREDQDIGTIELDVLPPSDSSYLDEQPNPEVRVVRD